MMAAECIFPAPDPDLYPILAGPSAWYPVELRAFVGGDPIELGQREARASVASYDHGIFRRSRVAEVEDEPQPAPVVTSAQTWEAWEESWYPAASQSFARRARALGWEARLGFSRGSVPGRAAGTWAIRDIIGCWVSGRRGRAVVTWERDPGAPFSARKLESGVKPGEIPSGQQWKSKGGHVVNGKSGLALAVIEAWMRGES